MKLTDCLVAQGKLNHDGYKRLRVGYKLQMLHRLIWTSANGSIPEGYEIHHKCKNRACYKLDHLELIGIPEHKSLSNRERAGTGYYKAVRKRNKEGRFIVRPRKSVTNKLVLSTKDGKLTSEDAEKLQKMEDEFKQQALELLAKYSNSDALWQVTIRLAKIG